ncbi:MAG: hypothetical protein AAF433_15160 [Bacteroidota bacterium]
MMNLKRKFTALILAAFSLTLAAQDALIDIDIDSQEWYENPYLWLGVAAFVVIVLLITRKKK